jgi:hypothetical protein
MDVFLTLSIFGLVEKKIKKNKKKIKKNKKK